MNWDTNETLLVIKNEEPYYKALERYIENELYFLVVLYVIIGQWNEHIDGNEGRIDTSKVNGNEVYVEFSKHVGNEQEGWK